MEADKNKIGKFINIRLLRSNIFYKEGRFAIEFTINATDEEMEQMR